MKLIFEKTLRNSMLLANHCPPIPSFSSSASLSFHVETLWHGCAYCYGLCSLTAYRFRFANRSMPAAFLDQRLPGYGRTDRNAVDAGCGGR